MIPITDLTFKVVGILNEKICCWQLGNKCGQDILTCETDFVLFLAVLENELRQLTRDVKSDVRTLNFKSDVTFAPPQKTPNDVQKRS